MTNIYITKFDNTLQTSTMENVTTYVKRTQSIYIYIYILIYSNIIYTFYSFQSIVYFDLFHLCLKCQIHPSRNNLLDNSHISEKFML